MANKKINELVSRTPSLTDLMLVGDPSSGYSYKCTINALATIIETDISDGYVTLSTTQTISGAKTFSNVLTLTSVANSASDTDKFLVLTGTNTVNYRTGTQVLSDIGGQGALTLTTTGTSGAATLVGNTLNIPNYAPDLSGYVPTSRTLTINGTSYDLSANRSWSVGTVTSVAASAGTGISISGSPITSSGTITITNTAPDQTVVLTAGTGISVSGTYPNFTITNSSPSSGGTVTSVAALTLGTTGTDLSSSVANGTTTPVITLNVPTASATNRGALSSTDWSTFNNKQNAITLTTTGSSGAATLVGNTLNIPNYAPDLSGYVPYTGATTTVDLNTRLISSGNSRIVGNDVSSGGYLGFKQFSGSSSGANGLTSVYAFGTTTLGISYSQSVGVVRSVYLSSSLISDNTAYYYSFPNKGGTFALLDDVTGAISGTTNYIPKFTSSSAIGNSVIYDNSGNIGINNTSAAEKLDVIGNIRVSSGNNLYVYNAANTRFGSLTTNVNGTELSSHNGAGEPLILTSPVGYINFNTNGSERLRISSTGNVSIGNTNNTYKLDVTGNTNISGTLNIQNASNIQWNGGDAGISNSGTSLIFKTYNGSSLATQMRLDASGNLGLGVTPSAGGLSGYVLFELANGGASIYSGANQSLNGTNISWSGGTASYKISNFATLYNQQSGQHQWYTAPSGTAGNAISFTQAMTLFSTGNLAVGGTSDAGYRLDVTGQIRMSAGALEYGQISASSGYNSGWQFYRAGYNNWYIGSTNNSVDFRIGESLASPTMTFKSGGNVGIGTTSPSQKLTIEGAYVRSHSLATDNTNAGAYFQVKSGSTTVGQSSQFVDNAGNWIIYTGTTSEAERMRITSGGELLINTTSDAGDYKLQVNGQIYFGTSSTSSLRTYVSSNIIGLELQGGAGSSSVAASAYLRIGDVTNGKYILQQIDNSGNLDYWFFNGSSWSNTMSILQSGNIESSGSIKTAAPSGYTAKPWKLGERVVTGVTFDATQYIAVEIDGVTHYLATITID